MAIPEVGEDGQSELLDSSVLVVGAGGLGSSALLHLASAGVGKIGIVDGDRVELSNLQRQIIHKSEDIGKPKVESARESLLEINSEPDIETYERRLKPEDVFEVIEGWDIVIDCSDNFSTKFLVNDACVLRDIPFSHGSVLRLTGMTTTVIPHQGPCYRCFTPRAPPENDVSSCQEVGVLGVLPGIIGSIQAAEAIKYIISLGEPLSGEMLHLDSSKMIFEKFDFDKNPSCPSCGEDPEITDLTKVDYEGRCDVKSG